MRIIKIIISNQTTKMITRYEFFLAIKDMGRIKKWDIKYIPPLP